MHRPIVPIQTPLPVIDITAFGMYRNVSWYCHVLVASIILHKYSCSCRHPRIESLSVPYFLKRIRGNHNSWPQLMSLNIIVTCVIEDITKRLDYSERRCEFSDMNAYPVGP
jgi:hypothetical protein